MRHWDIGGNTRIHKDTLEYTEYTRRHNMTLGYTDIIRYSEK